MFAEKVAELRNTDITTYLSNVGKCHHFPGFPFCGLKRKSRTPADILLAEYEDKIDASALMDPTNFVETIGVTLANQRTGRTTFVAQALSGEFYRMERDRANVASHVITEAEAVDLINAASANQLRVAVQKYSSFVS